ncbi:MAG: hypothetical protein ABI156_13005, partial [Caldimonas sp.]
LWGHPALLAASLLAAPTGTTLSIGDLPFHFVVDADGDQVALPCTERLINLDAAARLRAYGINALMAKKGEPELRVAGLEALSGQALALQAVAKSGARGSVSTAISSAVAGRDGASKPKAAAADDSAEADDTSEASDTAETADENSGDADSSADTSLDDLLASLGDGDAAPSEETEAGEASADDAAAADAEMDPDLAALLKSLEG